jgi:hypothetical protein
MEVLKEVDVVTPFEKLKLHGALIQVCEAVTAI